jgi:hypothetical protein
MSDESIASEQEEAVAALVGAPDAFLELVQAAAAAELERRNPPPVTPEVIDGWRIVSRVAGAHAAELQDDGRIKVAALWDVIIQHEDGRVREWQSCLFGANEANMLAWCVDQVQLAEVRERAEGERQAHEAERARLGLTEVSDGD